MVLNKKAVVLALFAIQGCYSPAFANSPLHEKLIETAQFWEQRGKEDNAMDAWRKLLKIDPSSPHALVAVGAYEARRGNADQAKQHLNKLREVNASAAQIRTLEEAIRMGASGARTQIDDARRLARQGDAEAAVESYRLLGDPSKLKGDAASEYYQTLAGTLKGYAEAKRGLEKLAKEQPGNSRYALAYAQVLTYREATRTEGMAQLEQLTAKPDVAKAARDSWRQALSWMGLKTSNARYFRHYLDKYPDDKTIQDKLDNLSRQAKAEVREERRPAKPRVENPVIKGQTIGFKALDDNDVPTAEKEFQSILKSHPKDPVGYGGMGLVKMRQEEFIESRKYLLKAMQLSSAKGKLNWKKAYDGAHYWASIEEARNAFEDGDSKKGIALLRQAIALDNKEPSGILQLADALQAENDMAGAEENFKRVFNEDKTNMRALDGLVGLYSLQKRVNDMEALSPYMLPRQLAILANSKAEELSEKAKKAEAAGDFATAQSALEDAILIKPEDAWLRMSLAKLYQKRNMPGQARALLDALTNVEKPDPEALYVSALLSEMQGLWWEGMMTLERVPANSRKTEMFTLQKRLWLKVQLDRIDILNKKGRTAEVKEILAAVDSTAANDPEFVGTVASLYIKLGDRERGFSMIRQLVQNTKQPTAGLLLQYASTLMQSNQEAELEAVMRKVAAMPKLSEDEILSFRQLQKALAMRYSERAREAGDFAAAYTYIQPMLIETPDDNVLLLTLARIYSSAGDLDQAKDLYNKVLETEPDNPEVLQGLVFAAINIKDFNGAEQHLDRLMRLQPDNPRYIALAGNVARAKGQNGKALGYFKKALALEQAQRPLAGKGADGLRLVETAAPAVAVTDFKVNPFAAKEGQLQTQTPVAKPVPGPVLREVPQLGPQHALPGLNPGAASSISKPQTQSAPMSSSPVSNAVVAPASPLSAAGAAPTPALARVSAQPAVVSPIVAGMSGSSAGSVATPQATVAAPVKAYTSAPSTAYAATNAQGLNTVSQSQAANAKRKVTKDLPDVSPEEAALIREIESLNELNRSEVTAGLSARARSGQSGLSQLKDVEMPIEAKLSTLGYGQFGLKIIPVVIDAGTLQLNDTNVAGQFAKNAILNERAKFTKTSFSAVAKEQGLSSASSIEQVAKGVALNLSYSLAEAGLKLDVGSSPINFPIRNVVGGVKWSTAVDSLNLSLELSRRSVTDSYLSYAGAKDSLFGLSWGGVTKNGARLDLSYDMEDGGLYGGLGAYSVQGTQVVKNTGFDLGGGAYWRVYKTKDNVVTAGVGMNTMFYKKNLRYFTYGHGGYFSPQSYLAVNLPVEWSGRNGRLAYQLGAAVGIQRFREDSALVYPLIAADQAALELFAAANPLVNVTTSYPGQSHTGLQYKLAGGLEYLLTPRFSVGGRFSVDNSGDFTDAAGIVYLRYTFEPRKTQVSFPPVVPKTYYQGN